MGKVPDLHKTLGRKWVLPLKFFTSYSHKDENMRKRLGKQLMPLKRLEKIKDWHDRKISPGEEWRGKIDEHLKTADVILLLISENFIGSDYCYDIEMTEAMNRHEAREARVIPVILHACDWKILPFGKLAALPKDGKPVSSWSNRHVAFSYIARGIRKMVEELTK